MHPHGGDVFVYPYRAKNRKSSTPDNAYKVVEKQLHNENNELRRSSSFEANPGETGVLQPPVVQAMGFTRTKQQNGTTRGSGYKGQAPHKAALTKAREAELQEQQIHDEETHAKLTAAANKIKRAYLTYNARFYVRWKSEAKRKQRDERVQRELNQLQQRAAIVVQTLWRGFSVRRWIDTKRELMKQQQQLKQFQEARVNNAALRIQTAYRAYNARFMVTWMKERRQLQLAAQTQEEKERMAQMNADKAEIQTKKQAQQKKVNAAIAIQKIWRAYNARFMKNWMIEEKRAQEKEENRKKLEQKAAVTIQCSFRQKQARVEMKHRHNVYVEQQMLALKAESLKQERDRTHAATAIQLAYRCYVARQLVQTLREKELAFRRHIFITERRNNAARKIQLAFRQHVACFELEYRRELQAQKEAQQHMT